VGVLLRFQIREERKPESSFRGNEPFVAVLGFWGGRKPRWTSNGGGKGKTRDAIVFLKDREK